MLWFMLCATLAVVAELASAHVTLTFPEARFPPLDFLDTFRTAAPCGVPKSSKSSTSNFRVGESYNVTWRMQYPHQGGFRLQLFNSDGILVQQLAPPIENGAVTEGTADTFDGLLDQTAEFHTVRFLHECHNCTLRLERQALEWGSSYRFRSCAEVNIFDSLTNTCSGHGESTDGGLCFCKKKYSGKHCQYEGDCSKDTDCLNGGKCIADGVAPNLRSCFCAYGFYGEDCSQRSLSYGDQDLSEENIDGEPCFAYNSRSDSTALKYGMFNVDCFKTFALNNADGDFIYTRVVKGEVEVVLDFVTDSWLGIGWRPLQIPTTCRLFPDLMTHATISTINLASGQNDSANIAIGGFLPSAFNASLHPMDCVDVVMASIIKDTSSETSFLHIRDMYTRDRSTPLSDEYFEGEQSLTAAYGRQIRIANNMTRSVVMFRRMIREIEPTDHPLGPGETFVIFAKGQTAGAYSHLAKSAIERDGGTNARTKNFYRADQWKYHGGKNRGVRRLELVSESEVLDAGGTLRHFPLPKTESSTAQSRDFKVESGTTTVQLMTTTTTTKTITNATIPAADAQTSSTNKNFFKLKSSSMTKTSTTKMQKHVTKDSFSETEYELKSSQSPKPSLKSNHDMTVDDLTTTAADNTTHTQFDDENSSSGNNRLSGAILSLTITFLVYILN